MFQEIVLLPQLKQPSPPSSTGFASFEPQATFEIKGHQIKFRVDSGGVLRASTGGHQQLDLDTSGIPEVSNARVTSMDLGVGPDGDVYFLALAVNSDILWPGTETNRSSAKFMKINE